MRFRKWFHLKRWRPFGASVFIHWSVLVVVLLLAALSLDSPIYAAVSITSYVSIITIHELGHAYVAQRRGYDVLAIRIAFLHGQCEHDAPDYEWDDVAIAWAGVLAQLLIAVPFLVLAAFFNRFSLGYLNPAIAILGYVNLIIALMNLAPTAPLDGATAWRVVPLLRDEWLSRRATARALRKWKRK